MNLQASYVKNSTNLRRKLYEVVAVIHKSSFSCHKVKVPALYKQYLLKYSLFSETIEFAERQSGCIQKFFFGY